MEQIGQNVAVGAILFLIVSMMLRRVPVLGFLFRLSTRLLLLFSPFGIAALLAATVWYHGLGTNGPATVAPVETGPTFQSPLPPERPR